EDGGVAGVPADLRRETENEIAAETGRLAGREVVRQHDDRFREVGERLPLLAEEMAKQTLFDVENVRRPFGEVFIAEVLKDLGVTAEDFARRRFGGELLLANQRENL